MDKQESKPEENGRSEGELETGDSDTGKKSFDFGNKFFSRIASKLLSLGMTWYGFLYANEKSKK